MNSEILYRKSAEHMQKFILQNLRKSGFVDPVTAEQQRYNEFITELCQDLDETPVSEPFRILVYGVPKRPEDDI
jgi:hypothetical protein